MHVTSSLNIYSEMITHVMYKVVGEHNYSLLNILSIILLNISTSYHLVTGIGK